MLGDSVVRLRAGERYVDRGAVAYDSVDGNITDRVRAEGNTVGVSDRYKHLGSCLEVLAAARHDGVPSMPSGPYVITPRRCKGASSHRRRACGALRVWCDMYTDGGGYTTLALRGAPVTRRAAAVAVPAGAGGAPHAAGDGCEARGLQLVVPRTRAHFGGMLARYGFNALKLPFLHQQ